MKKIHPFCSIGVSTSILAQKIQNVADAHDLPLRVRAYSHSKIGDIVEQLRPDCILFGPQVKYLCGETDGRFKETVPIVVINASGHGMMNGEKVLKTAIKLIKSFKK